MSILQNLVAASQLDESALRQQARSRQAQWQSWLAPISDSQPTGSDPGAMTMVSAYPRGGQ